MNLRGELVGVNSAILSRSGGNIGIGFAIPVNMVKGVMDQLIKYGQVKRGHSRRSALQRDAGHRQGAGRFRIDRRVGRGRAQGSGDAEHAGVKTGDIITSINGVAKKDAGELRNTIGMLRVGDKIEIGLLRDGKPRTVTAVIAEKSDLEIANAADINKGLEGAELSDAPDGGGVTGEIRPGRQPGGAERIARQRPDRRRGPNAHHRHQDVQGSRHGRGRPRAQCAARFRHPAHSVR